MPYIKYDYETSEEASDCEDYYDQMEQQDLVSDRKRKTKLRGYEGYTDYDN